MIYDSVEEEIFVEWLKELQEAGFVLNYKYFRKHEGFCLSNEVQHNWIKNRNNKSISEIQVLLQSHYYTPDFYIIWAEKAYGYFIDYFTLNNEEKIDKSLIIAQSNNNSTLIPQGIISIVDTKGSFQRHGGLTEFRINQKWIYDKYKLFVNMVKVPEIFEKTFIPKSYLKTKTGKDRKINFKFKLLEEYVQSKTNI